MSLYSTTTLLGVKKNQKPFTSFFKTLFFSRESFSDSEKVAIDEVVPNLRLAPFVSPMVAGKVRKQDGYSTTLYAPPYLKPKDVVNPKKMQSRMAGEALNGSMTAAQRLNATVAFLLDDQEKAIERTEEKMCVDAVLTGKFIVEDSEEHEAMEVDYSRSASNNVALVGAARWSQLDKDTTDMATIINDYAELSSGLASIIIFDKKAFSLFTKFKGVQDSLNKTVANGDSDIMLAPQLKREVQFKGRYGEYAIYVYAGYYELENKTKKYFMPDNTMVLAPAQYDGVMAYGAIQDVEAGSDGMAMVKRWPKSWITPEPSARYLMTQSAPLPIMPDADEFVVVTVDGPV
ncbi:major capsid protein [Marinomonas spartinae]|uniref:major capsid protein n=1 Tax=Marinomonas spartinae TaxID=1792290 RepID=UPI0018F2155D|nr:major capsid protein [Marinomonas spartinae]MBJ7555394.1 major capsid protein [Marinomonas spartinae]